MSVSLLSVGLWKQTFESFLRDKVARLAAAVAYYALFALAPLLIIVLGLATILFGEQAAAGELHGQLAQVVGHEIASALEFMIMSRQPQEGFGATAIGVLLLVFGATGVFVQLKDALNAIVGIRRRSAGALSGVLKGRMRAALMVFVVGVLMLLTVVISLASQSLGNEPGKTAGLLLQALTHLGVSVVLTLVFAWLFRALRDGRLPWRVLWMGALVAGVFFSAGQWGLSIYMTRGGAASSSGVLGSILAVLFWVYYSCLVFLFGFELAKVWAARLGVDIRPATRADTLPRFSA